MDSRIDREMVCRRIAVDSSGDSGRAPFVLSGAEAVYAPDRVCDVEHIRIEVTLDFERRSVEGTCTLEISPINDGDARLTLNAQEMEISEVMVAGQKVSHRHEGALLHVELGARKQNEKLALQIRYRATPRRGLYFIHPDSAYPNRPLQVWTQGQDEDNRCWFPCFDHPHEKSTSEVVANIPEKMTALSNGRLLGDRKENGRRIMHYRHEVPHSSYLITLVAGVYEQVKEQVGETELYYFFYPGQEELARRSLSRTGKMIELFAARTGQPYPYPRYSQIFVADFIFGGMENTSATTLTDLTLHDPRAALDFSSEPLISHELAHQWFGDLVTCRDWAQGWLNEGFATFMEIVWKEHIENVDEADYDRQLDMESYFHEDSDRYRRAIVSQVFHEPIDVFERHLYEKGSSVLHMLRNELGESRFWKGVRHYLAKHRGGMVETRDLVRALEEATGWNGDRFFNQWIFRAGHPDFKIEYSWDESAKVARLSVQQTQESPPKKDDPGTPLFQLKVPLHLVVDGVAREIVLKIDKSEEIFVIACNHAPTQAIFDPGMAYLKTVDWKKPESLWKAELAWASRAIDRVQAARALGKAGDPTAVSALVQSMNEDKMWMVRGEAALALSSIKTDAARDAIISRIEAERHPKARRQLVKALGAFRHDELAARALEEKLKKRDESYFVEAESALSLAKTRSLSAFDLLKSAMTRPSYLDVIQSMCLQGMAELRDERAADVALEYARYGKPAIGRRAAIAALGSLGAELAPRAKQIVETLSELLDDPDFRARIAAVEALKTIGDRAAIGPLGRAERRDTDGRVRRRAREVARAIEAGSSQGSALKGLRESVERLELENRTLQERVSKLELNPSGR